MHEWQFDAIGTAWQIDTRGPLPDDVQSQVLGRIEEFDRAWSRFRTDSLVTQMSQRAGTWTMPDEAEQLLSFYAELYDVTDGAVDPAVGQTLVDLGYDADYSLVSTEAEFVGGGYASTFSFDLNEQSTLKTLGPVLLDFGAAGKGLLVDLIEGIVGQATHEFTIDASGDMYHNGTTRLRVALEHPLDPTKAIGVAELEPEDALCASATNRRVWGDGLHHVIDARTGRPTEDVIATWVVAPQSCMRADGLATAHFFAEPDLLMSRFQHEFVRMHADGRIDWSPDFPGEIFL